MTITNTLRRWGVPLVLALYLSASPAQAAGVTMPSDFNDDGVTDRVVLLNSPETTIVVQVSGSEPQILSLAGPLFSFVTTDVDRDGDLDLAALEKQHGLVIWLNKDGHGRFEAERTTQGSSDVALSHGPLATSREAGDRQSVAQTNTGGTTLSGHVPRVGTLLPPPSSRSTRGAFSAVDSLDPTDFAASRAPPIGSYDSP